MKRKTYSPTRAELIALLKDCKSTLSELAQNPAFEGDAPEFNEGGYAYRTCEELRRVLAACEKPAPVTQK